MTWPQKSFTLVVTKVSTHTVELRNTRKWQTPAIPTELHINSKITLCYSALVSTELPRWYTTHKDLDTLQPPHLVSLNAHCYPWPSLASLIHIFVTIIYLQETQLQTETTLQYMLMSPSWKLWLAWTALLSLAFWVVFVKLSHNIWEGSAENLIEALFSDFLGNSAIDKLHSRLIVEQHKSYWVVD